MSIRRKRQLLVLLDRYHYLTANSAGDLLGTSKQVAQQAFRYLVQERKVNHKPLPRKKGQMGQCCYNYFLINLEGKADYPHLFKGGECFTIAGIQFMYHQPEHLWTPTITIRNLSDHEQDFIMTTIHEKYKRCFGRRTDCPMLLRSAIIYFSLVDAVPICCKCYRRIEVIKLFLILFLPMFITKKEVD